MCCLLEFVQPCDADYDIGASALQCQRKSNGRLPRAHAQRGHATEGRGGSNLGMPALQALLCAAPGEEHAGTAWVGRFCFRLTVWRCGRNELGAVEPSWFWSTCLYARHELRADLVLGPIELQTRISNGLSFPHPSLVGRDPRCLGCIGAKAEQFHEVVASHAVLASYPGVPALNHLQALLCSARQGRCLAVFDKSSSICEKLQDARAWPRFQVGSRLLYRSAFASPPLELKL
jgi:hypothetical protein